MSNNDVTIIRSGRAHYVVASASSTVVFAQEIERLESEGYSRCGEVFMSFYDSVEWTTDYGAPVQYINGAQIPPARAVTVRQTPIYNILMMRYEPQ